MGMNPQGDVLDQVGSVLNVIRSAQQSGGRAASGKDASRRSEDMAVLAEMEAEDKARDARREATREANEERDRRRRERSRRMAAFGASGLALSGSPLAVLQGRAVEDEAAYQSLLGRGRTEAQEALDAGGRRAAAYRATAAAQRRADESDAFGPARSLLNAGSMIFNPGYPGSRGGRR